VTSESGKTILIFVIIAAASLTIKAPFAANRPRLCPDTIAYLDIAHHISIGQGFISTLKLNSLDSSAIKHSALTDWPPLYPLFAASITGLGGDDRALQIASAIFISIAAGLVFLIGAKLFTRRTGIAAGILAAMAPNLFRAGTVAMSDALSLMLALAVITCVLYAENHPACWSAVGVMTGLAFLTRFPNALLFIILMIFLAAHPARRRYLVPVATGLAVTIAPYLLWKWVITGSPFSSAQWSHYTTLSISHTMWNYDTMPADHLFAVHHPWLICRTVGHNLVSYIFDLLIGFRGLFLLSIGLLYLLIRKNRTTLAPQHKLILMIATVNFTFYLLTWSIPPVRGSRFMLLSYCILLPFCIDGIRKLMPKRSITSRRIAAVGFACVAGVYIWGCVTASVYTDGEIRPIGKRTATEIACMLPPGANIASNNPWAAGYSTGIPTALLPHNLDRQSLARFIAKYHIGAVVIFGDRPHSQTLSSLRVYQKTAPFCIFALSHPRDRSARRDYGQNAYEGMWNMMPQIVQKLPTTHSARITPRKNGSARL